MTPDQVIAAIMALGVAGAYACRMGLFDLRQGDHPLMGLSHYAGFCGASWVFSEALQHPLEPTHGVALLGSALWLLASFPRLAR